MERLAAILGLTVGLLIGSAGAAERTTAAEEKILGVIRLLSTVPTGDWILKQGVKRWELTDTKDLLLVIHPDQVSRTDAVLTRHYDPVSGKERRERRVSVHLRLDLPLMETALDLAHEMTHAVQSPDWDPYDPELSAADYIRAAIEGRGGEVDAVTLECGVAAEFEKQLGIKMKRCARYFGAEGAIERSRVIKDFYRVGASLKELVSRLPRAREFFPQLSEDAPMLFSSTGQAPYPVSLLREYDEITRIACENSQKRLSIKTREGGRVPASVGSELERLIKGRCNEVRTQAAAITR
jgi:hypothetical protein